jgi:hypothetical protein
VEKNGGSYHTVAIEEARSFIYVPVVMREH